MGTIMSLEYISFFKLRIQKDVDDDVMWTKWGPGWEDALGSDSS